MRRLLAVLFLLVPALASAQYGQGDGGIRFQNAGTAGLSSSGTAITSTVPLGLPGGSGSARALYLNGFPAHGIYFPNQFAIDVSALRIDTSSNYISSVNNNAYDSGSAATKWKTVYAGTSYVLSLTTGESATQGVATELLTLSTSGATTDTTANLLPANAIIDSVVVRVTTAITTAATFTVGDPTTAARFASGVAAAAGTTSVGLAHMQGGISTDAAGPAQTAAAKVRITCNTTPGAGVVRITVFYRTFAPPSS